MAAGEPNTSEQTTTPPTVTPPEQTADGVTFTPEQQAAIDEIMGKVRKEARERTKSDLAKARTKAEAEAEAARLVEQEEYKTLAEQHAARIGELEPLEAQIADYTATVDVLLAARIEALGESAKTAVEGLPGELDALSKLKWLNANEALFATQAPPDIGARETGHDDGEVVYTDEEVAQYAVEMNISPRFVDRRAMAADLQARARS